MVLFRERVFSLKWLVVSLLLSAVALNLFWLLKIRTLESDWILLLLMFSGMVVPFLWMATVAVGRFLLLDVLMGFLGEVSESFSGMRQQLQQWLQQRDLAEEHQHDDKMEKIRKVRHQWSKRAISRKDAVDRISRINRGKKRKRGTKKRVDQEQQGESMPGLMSGFIDRILDEKKK